MLFRGLLSLAVACLAIGPSWAADDPFVGQWKVNTAKSKLTDEMKVASVGGNKYAFTFAPGAVDTIVADGTDQPAMQGTTLAVTVKGPNDWTVVRKKDGKDVIRAIWTLSADGNTLDDDFNGVQANGSPLKLHYVYRRSVGGAGFTGTWDSISAAVDSTIEVEIQPYSGAGLSIVSQSLGLAEDIQFDGQYHPATRPTAPPGSLYSGQRVNPHSLEITRKVQDDIKSRQQFEVSADLKSLTVTFRLPGEREPRDVLVLDRG